MAKWAETNLVSEEQQKLDKVRSFIKNELDKINSFMSLARERKAWISGESYQREELLRNLWEIVK